MKKLNRRNFLKNAVSTAAGAISLPYIIPSSVLGADGRAAAGNQITIGCIGVGGQGTGDMLGFLGQPDAQVVAVCDVERESSGYYNGYHAGREHAKRLVETHYASQKEAGTYKGCDVYSDFRELLAREDIDAVIIATPDHWHAINAIAAAAAGKDIYCEKPISHNIAEGRAMCDAVKKYNVIWQTGSQQRSDGKFRKACELVRNGRIGKVNLVEVGLPKWTQICPAQPEQPVPDGFDYNMWLGPAPAAPYTKMRCHFNWRWIYDYGNGIITDWGAHHIDIAQWAMNTEHTGPMEIEGKGEFPQDSLWNVPYAYRVECKYAEGFTMLIGDTDKFASGIRFHGTQGWIHVNRESLTAEPKSVLDSVIGPNEIHLYKSDNHFRNFLDCVCTRTQAVAPVEAAHRTITIAHLGTIAMKTGTKLKWDPKKEQIIGDIEASRLMSRAMRSPWRLDGI